MFKNSRLYILVPLTVVGLIILGMMLGSNVAAQDDESNLRDNPMEAAALDAPFLRSPLHYGSSPFEPPEDDSSTFVVDTGPGLDTGCSFADEGDLVFEVKVGRYIGDVERLSSGNLIPEYAVLEMPAYDVDYYGGGSYYGPERDKVYFNGTVLSPAYLTGNNDIWVYNSFKVPYDLIQFATPGNDATGTAATPGINTIRIVIDTLNYPPDTIWCTAIDWAALKIDVPYPLLLVHGLFGNGGPDSWQGPWRKNAIPLRTQSWITNLGFPAATITMGTGEFVNGTATIQDDAYELEQRINNLSQAWGVNKFNIVSHSKGGLDSRHYAETHDTIATLAQIGTPNQGAPFVDYLLGGTILLSHKTGFPLYDLIDLAAPGIDQLTVTHMTFYNFFHGYNPNTTYVSLAGEYTHGNLWDAFFLGLHLGKNDTVVPTWSVHALDYAQHKAYSSYGPDSEARHACIKYVMECQIVSENGVEYQIAETSSKKAYNILLPYLKKTQSGSSETLTTPQSLTTLDSQAVASSVESTVTISDQIEQGQTHIHMLAIDSSASVNFTLQYSKGDLDLVLISPSGVRIDPVAASIDPNIDFDVSGMFGLITEGYATSATEVGVWTLEVSAPTVTDSSGKETYFVAGWLSDPMITFQAETDHSFYASGTPILVRAEVLDNTTPILGANVQATILFPDESTTVLNLLDNGTGDDTIASDGIYTGRLSSADLAGLYRVAVTAEGTSPRPFSRQRVLLTTVSSSTSSLSGGYNDYGNDTDDNSLYNEVVVDVDLQITEAATYHIMGELATQSGEVIATDIVNLPLSPGLQTVSLQFDASRFFEHQYDGPYQLSVVRLAEDDGLTVMPLDEALNAYTTAAYDHRMFEHPAIYMPGTGSDYGIDWDGNGLYDELQVDVDLELMQSGSYYWSGQLVNIFGDTIGVTDGYEYLTSGLETISFVFSGEIIGESGIDGPYYLQNILVYSSYNSAVLTDTYTTGSYTANQFEGGSTEVPGKPVLRFPENGAFVVSTTPAFLWHSVAYGNTYQIQIDNNSNFSSPVQDVVVRGLSYTVSPLKENIRYYWRVRAFSSAGIVGKWSQKWSMTVDSSPPAIPELRSPGDRTDISDTTPRLQWSNVAGANQYRIELSSSLDFIDPEISSLANRNNFSVPDDEALAYGRYYWRVQAGDAANNWSEWSDVHIFTVTFLKSPKNGDFTTDTTPTLRWNKVKGAAWYHLQVSVSDTFATFVFNDATLTGTQFTSTTELDHGRYYWRMQVDAGGGYVDNWTPVWTFTVTSEPPNKPDLTAPANKELVANAAPIFTWGEVTDGDTYQIQIDDQSNFKSPVQDATVDGLTYPAEPLTNLGKYYWRVRAINGVGVAGTWSSTWSFTLPGPADAPVLVDPTDKETVCGSDVPLTWGEITGITTFQVQVSTSKKFSPLAADTIVTGQTTTIDELADGRYYWRVRPVDAQGVGGTWTNPWSFVVDTVGPLPPVLKAPKDLTATLDTTPTFTWGRVRDAEWYHLQVSTDPGCGTTVVDEDTLTKTRFVVPDTTPLGYGRYYWQVASMDTCHWGEPSVPVTFSVTIHKTPKDASVTTDTTPTFTWASASVSDYVFQLAKDPDFLVDPFQTTVTTTKYTPTIPLDHSLYYWRVSIDAGATWMPTWTVTVTSGTLGKPKLTKPANKSLINHNTPMFDWELVAGGAAYQIQIDDDKGFYTPDWSVTLDASEVPYTVPELGEGTWYWRVRMLNGQGAPGKWSAIWSLTVDITPPTIPVPIAPAGNTRVTNPKLVLEWLPSEGVVRYEVQLDIDPTFPLPPIDVGKKTTYTPPSSLAQATYYWRVRAVDKAGNVSLWSDMRIFNLVAGNTIVTPPIELPVLVPAQEPVVEPPPSTPDDGPATPEPPVIVPLPPGEPSDPAAPPDQPDQPPALE